MWSSSPASIRVRGARPGDIIAYDWKNDQSYDHLALVVSIAPNQYPEVAEWGTTVPPQIQSRYTKRGSTWSAVNNTWLQNASETKEVRALLIKVRL